MCKLCDERGQTWKGAPPQCAFDERGVFASNNWNCATMQSLREIAEPNAIWNEDDYSSLIPLRENGGYILLNWYKHRARTQGAWFVDEGVMIPIVLEKALECIDEYKT